VRPRPSWIVVAVLAAGCGGKRDPAEPDLDPAPGRDAPTEVARELFAAQTAMAAAAADNVASCPAMATALRGVFDRVRPLFERATTLRADPDYARSLNLAMKPYDADAEAQAKRMFEALAACRLDAAVADAVAQMPVLQ
jgi:hypothetical protein